MKIAMLLPGKEDERQDSWAITGTWDSLVDELRLEGYHVLHLYRVGDDVLGLKAQCQKNLSARRLGIFLSKADVIITGTADMDHAVETVGKQRISLVHVGGFDRVITIPSAPSR